jgi:RNA-directed DNA polymerase
MKRVREMQSESLVVTKQLLEEVISKENILQAVKQVESNKGSAGVDGMTVVELRPYLRKHWPEIRKQLLTGIYIPKPVKRVEIPKPCGGVRKLGIPTVVDRFIQQAVNQVLQRYWEPTFSESSYGFRPGRSAHQAVAKAQQYVREGYRYVVDIDLEKFFDRVNHDVLMDKVEKRIKDKRVVVLIRAILKSGVLENGVVQAVDEGTPQGGPLSPILSNLMLDELDRELERRGHKFVRYADDCNTYVRSLWAGKRVMRSITRFLERKLKLKVNQEKSAVARPWKRKFLGFTFGRDRKAKRTISSAALKRFKARIRELTRKTRGMNFERVVAELQQYLKGWGHYYCYCEARTILKYLDSWIRRRLRSMLWKQWGRRGYRELRKRGVSQDLAWNTSKSAHGTWRLSRSPALNFALPGKYFDSIGLPRLAALLLT